MRVYQLGSKAYNMLSSTIGTPNKANDTNDKNTWTKVVLIQIDASWLIVIL